MFGGGGGPAGLFEWIVKREDLYFATWLVRDVLERSYDYEGAVSELSTRPLIAPCYFIVSGTEHNQGHLITRGRNETIQPLQLNLEDDRWYLLETNYDHWEKPFFLGKLFQAFDIWSVFQFGVLLQWILQWLIYFTDEDQNLWYVKMRYSWSKHF